MRNNMEQASKYLFAVLSLCLLIIMIFIQINVISIKETLSAKNIECEKYKKKYEQLEIIQTGALGKNINILSLYSIEKGELKNIKITNGIIVFASLSGCGKCVDHHLEVVNKRKRDDLYYIIESDKIDQLKAIKQMYGIHNIYGDKNSVISSLVGFDTKRNNPFVLFVKNGIIISMKFSYLDESDYYENEIKRLM